MSQAKGKKSTQAAPATADPLTQMDRALSAGLGHPLMVVLLALLCAFLAMRGNLWDHIHNAVPYEEENHIHFIDAAADALSGGSLLIREIPWVGKVNVPVIHRYALLQFYGQFPFFLGAVLVNLGLPSYHAFLALGFLSYFLSFVGCFVLARALGLRPMAGLAGALLFTLAPYHLTDWYGRFAFTETFALGLLPWALYSSIRCAQRRDLLSLLFSSMVWSMLMLSHTITHIFAALVLLGAVCIQWALFDRKDLAALLRPILAYGLGLLCSAWALAPIVRFGDQFNIAHSFDPRNYAFVSTLPVLLSRSFYAVSAAGPIGLQVGWPLLAALIGGVALLFRRPRLGVFAVLAILSFVLAWSPMNIFGSLGSLSIIQFPYRMLGFVAILGSIVGAGLWDEFVGRWQALLLLALAVIVVLASAPYRPLGDGGVSSADVSSFYSKGGTQYAGPPYDYVIGDPNSAWMQLNYPNKDSDLGPLPNSLNLAEGVDLRTAAAIPLTYTPTAKELKALKALTATANVTAATASVKFGRVTEIQLHALQKGDVVLLPSPWYPAFYDFSVNGKSTDYSRVGNRLAIQATDGGDLNVAYRFRGLIWANILSYFSWTIFFLLLVLHLMGRDLGSLRPASTVPVKANAKTRRTR